jgi:hypothetical protein
MSGWVRCLNSLIYVHIAKWHLKNFFFYFNLLQAYEESIAAAMMTSLIHCSYEHYFISFTLFSLSLSLMFCSKSLFKFESKISLHTSKARPLRASIFSKLCNVVEFGECFVSFQVTEAYLYTLTHIISCETGFSSTSLYNLFFFSRM